MATRANSTRMPAIRRPLPPELIAVPFSPAVPSDGLRALTMYDAIPAGHIGVLVENGAFEPHLHAGEFAIVDTSDKERQVGELYVLTIGIALSLFNAGFGVGVSARVPFTQSNVTLAAAIGAKAKAPAALPDYTYGRLGGNQNFINNSPTLTIGPAAGAAIFVIGKQGGAPVLDLHLVLR